MLQPPLGQPLARSNPSSLFSLRLSQILDALVAAVHPDDADRYKALYSSDLGGVVTEPALMVIAADDHAVHRGHAVFDTAAIIEGRIYLLDAHLERFFKSAASAGLTLPYSRAQVRRVVLETAAAARTMDGNIRLWLGAGRGGYGLSPAECRRPSLHVAVYTPRGTTAMMTPEGDPGGLSVRTAAGVPPPDAWAAGIKSTNYLRNALAQAEAEAGGFDLGVFADPETGIVTEAANASVGIITHGGELVIPPWDRALPGVTAQRVLDLLPKVIKGGEEKEWREKWGEELGRRAFFCFAFPAAPEPLLARTHPVLSSLFFAHTAAARNDESTKQIQFLSPSFA